MTIVFGEGAGYEGGDHKCFRIDEYNPDRSSSEGGILWVRNYTGKKLVSQIRFSFLGHIPTGAVVSSATMYLYLFQNALTDMDVHLRRALRTTGVTNSDAGPQEDPATSGQPTWDHSFDKNGSGDINWLSGVSYGASDRESAAEATISILNAHTTGHEYSADMTGACQEWINNEAENFGEFFESDVINRYHNGFCPFDYSTVGYRPRLEIEYIETGFRRRQARINTGAGVGCGTFL